MAILAAGFLKEVMASISAVVMFNPFLGQQSCRDKKQPNRVWPLLADIDPAHQHTQNYLFCELQESYSFFHKVQKVSLLQSNNTTTQRKKKKKVQTSTSRPANWLVYKLTATALKKFPSELAKLTCYIIHSSVCVLQCSVCVIVLSVCYSAQCVLQCSVCVTVLSVWPMLVEHAAGGKAQLSEQATRWADQRAHCQGCTPAEVEYC